MISKSKILEEYFKCATDTEYAIESYLRTFDKTQEGFVPFKLFEKQKEIIGCYEKYRNNLITKPRQAGISTTTQAYAAIKCAYADKNNPETIIVIANKLTLAKKFLKGIRDFVVQLPRWTWGPEYYGDKKANEKDIFLVDSQIHIQLPNGSQVIAVATSTDALRGYTPTFLVFDEAAYIDNGAELYAAAVTSMSTGGKAILISTPNGMDPLYYKTYEQAQIKDDNGEPTNGYNIIEMKWYQDPRYNKDLEWLKTDKESGEEEKIKEVEFTHDHFEEMIKNGYKPTSSWYQGMCKTMNYDSRRIAQELDVSFLGSGGNVIADEYITMHENENVQEPLFVDETYSDGNSGLINIWAEPVEDHEYIMAVDVARGDGADSSTFVIVDFTTMEEVAEYQGKIPPDMLAEPVFQYGNLYNAYVIVDNIGLGWTTISKLIELGYKDLHYDKPRPNANKNDQLSFTKNGLVPGFNSNGVRLNMIANLESNIRLNTIKIRSKRMCMEMKTFIYKNGKPDHMEGYHDDLLISMGMLLWVLESSFKNLKKAKVKAKAMLSGWVSKDGSRGKNTTYKPKSEIKIKGTNAKAPTYLNNNSKNNLANGQGNHMWLFSGYR